jgi:hypothetical protein
MVIGPRMRVVGHVARVRVYESDVTYRSDEIKGINVPVDYTVILK